MELPSSSQLLNQADADPQETREWLDALQAVMESSGSERARFLLSTLSAAAREWKLNWRYARAFLEGRLNETDLAFYRQEIAAKQQGARNLSSYPHPWLMPDFWQFPTGSMGLGPINAIYQARFMRYLEHRQLLQAQDRKVW